MLHLSRDLHHLADFMRRSKKYVALHRQNTARTMPYSSAFAGGLSSCYFIVSANSGLTPGINYLLRW